MELVLALELLQDGFVINWTFNFLRGRENLKGLQAVDECSTLVVTYA